MRMLVVFCLLGMRVAPIQLLSISGLTCGSVGGGVALTRNLATGLIRAGSITFGTPRYERGCRRNVTGSVVSGSYRVICLPWLSTKPRKSPLRIASVGMVYCCVV